VSADLDTEPSMSCRGPVLRISIGMAPKRLFFCPLPLAGGWEGLLQRICAVELPLPDPSRKRPQAVEGIKGIDYRRRVLTTRIKTGADP